MAKLDRSLALAGVEGSPAVQALARRIVGSLADAITFTPLDAEARTFEYEARNGRLRIASTDAISASVGLHRYLREVCHRSVGWDTTLPLPVLELPAADRRSVTARVEEGIHLNPCTFSYTFPYWTWDEWEPEIDWLALHGITMPLAYVGHEAVLLESYRRLGLAESEVLEYLGGPGYLPFQYMGCLDSFAGPMSRSWVDEHLALGRRILDRQRELGMTPILPAFAGSIPERLAPTKVTRREWVGFPTFFLDPRDSLYREIGATIVQVQRELLGTDHLYSADPFIEMLPVSSDPGYPAAVASATLAGLEQGDPDARWVLQAWPFSYHRDYWTPEQVRDLLDAIPDERLYVLDLWGEMDPQWVRLEGFSEKPWAWCALLNFGGRTDLIGDLERMINSADRAVSSSSKPTGIGMSTEAILNNPAYFELVTDQIWVKTPDLTDWIDAFADERYGAGASVDLRHAWRDLSRSVYQTGNQVVFSRQWSGVLPRRPSFIGLDAIDGLRAAASDALWYDPITLARAWERLLAAAEADPSLADGPLGHDLVDVAAAAMSRVADRLHFDLVVATIERGERDALATDRFLALFDDLDRVLATRPEFTLGQWEVQAASWARDGDERRILLDNVRRILTVWDRPSSPYLDDYAGRLWAGLVGGYYRRRWEIWCELLDPSVLADPSRGEVELQRRMEGWAAAFIDDGVSVVHDALGDVVSESRRLFDRYGRTLREARLQPETRHEVPERDAGG